MSKEDYARMQKRQYDVEASRWSLTNKDPVVGWYDYHEKSPLYDENLFRNLKPEHMKEWKALDFGCGPGRMMIRFHDQFKQIDGVDISQINLDNARINILDAELGWNGELYQNDGLGIPTPQDEYDVVFSVICLQHIASHSIRMSIMKDAWRTLRPGGVFCFQMGAGPRPQSAGYYEDQWNAPGTNGTRDVQVDLNAENEPHELIRDLKEIDFVNIDWKLSEPIQDLHEHWVWVQAYKPLFAER